MFYCEQCRKNRRWPKGMRGSHGRCEVCGKTRACYDVPSYALPAPRRRKAEAPDAQ